MGHKPLSEEEKVARRKQHNALQLKKRRMDPKLKAHDNKLQIERRKRKREMEAASKSSKHPRLESLAGTGLGCQEGVLTNVNCVLY